MFIKVPWVKKDLNVLAQIGAVADRAIQVHPLLSIRVDRLTLLATASGLTALGAGSVSAQDQGNPANAGIWAWLTNNESALTIAAGFFGILLMLGLLFLAAIVLRWHRLHDHKFALGLPQHSVRATIALSFIVLLGTLGVFAVNSAKTTEVTVAGPISANGPNFAAARLAATDALRASAGLPADANIVHEQTAASQDQVTVSARAVVFRENQEASRIARELLAVVATALVTIIGFYFGARSQENNTSGNAPNPQNAPVGFTTLAQAQIELQSLIEKVQEQLDADPPLAMSSSDKAEFDRAKKLVRDIDDNLIKLALDPVATAASLEKLKLLSGKLQKLIA